MRQRGSATSTQSHRAKRRAYGSIPSASIPQIGSAMRATIQSAFQESLVCFGVFELNLHTGELRKQGLRVKLNQQAFKVLAALLGRPGEMRTREELRQRLWPNNTFVDFEHNLNKLIHAVREALGDSATNPRFIETIAGQGYRFVPIPQSGAEKRRAPDELESIAVLPFTLACTEPDMPFVASRLTASVINALSRESSARVLAYNTVRNYATAPGTPRAMGEELGVQAVVLGEILRRNDEAIIQIELIDTADGAQLWGLHLKQNWPDLPRVTDQIALDIVRKLKAAIHAKGNRLYQNAQYRTKQEVKRAV